MGHRRIPGDQVRVDGVARLSPRETGESSAAAAEELVDELLSAFGTSAAAAAQLLWARGAEKLRRMAGSVEHLERLLGNELFAPLVRFERLDRQPQERIGDSARQVLTVFRAGGEPARFLLSLKRATSREGADSWSVTGLEREW